MKNKITVIIYTESSGSIGHTMISGEFWFWNSKRKLSQKILWELVNEIDENEAITNIQIF